jgi:sulfur carrier protein ThiS adenylyltransferase
MTDEFRKDIAGKIGRAGLEKVLKTRIGIAGAGGLGSNCAMNLVRVGFQKFTIADFDMVAASNLDRQFYFSDQVGLKKTEALKANLLRIDPEIDIRVISKKIGPENINEIFGDSDVVVECFDKAEYKSMLVSALLESGKFIVTASGLGGIGSSDDIRVHRIKDNLVVIGDLKSDIEKAPALSPRVNIAAAKQADVVLEHILNLP